MDSSRLPCGSTCCLLLLCRLGGVRALQLQQIPLARALLLLCTCSCCDLEGAGA